MRKFESLTCKNYSWSFQVKVIWISFYCKQRFNFLRLEASDRFLGYSLNIDPRVFLEPSSQDWALLVMGRTQRFGLFSFWDNSWIRQAFYSFCWHFPAFLTLSTVFSYQGFHALPIPACCNFLFFLKFDVVNCLM